MALTRTDHTATNTARTSGQTFAATSASFTPSANSLVVVTVGIEGAGPNGGPTGTPTITNSGTGLTWTRRLNTSPSLIDGGAPGDYWASVEIWSAPSAGASMTITWTHPENVVFDIANLIMHVVSYTGYDTGTPTGASITNTTTGDAGLTITLSGAPATDSEVIACRARLDAGSAATGATPDGTWTELFDTSSAASGYLDHETMSRTGSTSTSVIWTDTSTNASASSLVRHAAALEIRAGAATTDCAGSASGTSAASAVGAMLASLVADADITDGGWLTDTGGTSLFAAIDETVASDTDYIVSSDVEEDVCEVNLANPTSAMALPFSVAYRYKRFGANTVTLRVQLMEGVTERAEWDTTVMNDTFVEVEQFLTAPEFASIADFTDLRVRFTAIQGGALHLEDFSGDLQLQGDFTGPLLLAGYYA